MTPGVSLASIHLGGLTVISKTMQFLMLTLLSAVSAYQGVRVMPHSSRVVRMSEAAAVAEPAAAAPAPAAAPAAAPVAKSSPAPEPEPEPTPLYAARLLPFHPGILMRVLTPAYPIAGTPR